MKNFLSILVTISLFLMCCSSCYAKSTNNLKPVYTVNLKPVYTVKVIYGAPAYQITKEYSTYQSPLPFRSRMHNIYKTLNGYKVIQFVDINGKQISILNQNMGMIIEDENEDEKYKKSQRYEEDDEDL